MIADHDAEKSRIDAPGALQHVIIRGIEHRKIFRSDIEIASKLRISQPAVSRSSKRGELIENENRFELIPQKA